MRYSFRFCYKREKMTEQLSRHPHRRVEPHPLDGTLAMAGKLIIAPIKGLQYVEKYVEKDMEKDVERDVEHDVEKDVEGI